MSTEYSNIKASFPNNVWDGSSPTRTGEEISQLDNPNGFDWARMSKEIIATQTAVKDLIDNPSGSGDPFSDLLVGGVSQVYSYIIFPPTSISGSDIGNAFDHDNTTLEGHIQFVYQTGTVDPGVQLTFTAQVSNDLSTWFDLPGPWVTTDSDSAKSYIFPGTDYPYSRAKIDMTGAGIAFVTILGQRKIIPSSPS